ncbi:hypothetical protein Pint_04808 [Pistacia integerrima]|uniref:Uncharacterized protein n=1 Tax=Pistacia integerrima TaxID=434235 RepID=A0ACC0Z7D3_9ROSI|nr:hypothetical protein Pint_04808 [Pistacia integerrima]
MLENHSTEGKDGSVEVKVSEHCKIKTEDVTEEVKISEDYTVDSENDAEKETKTRKRRLSTITEEGHIQNPEKRYKKMILSLKKPSYLLRCGLGAKNVRRENRNRLRYLLCKLVKLGNWTDACGVLSVLLKGTSKEKCPVANRLKYMVSMELFNHVESERINPIRIKNVYDIWMKRIASAKDSPLEDKFVVHLEFILFCLTRGDVDEAHQAAMGLMQEREFGSHPMANMVMALTFCQRWYSSIPKDMQWDDSDQMHSPGRSDFSGSRLNHEVENSGAPDTVNSYKADTHFRCDSETSVMIGKKMSLENDSEVHGPVEDNVSLQRGNLSQPIQPLAFFINSTETEDSSPMKDAVPVNYASVFVALEGLDSWLLPVRLPNSSEDYEIAIRKYRKLLNDDYKNAVKYLRFALYSTPAVSAALLPLIQLLLIGGHVDEALIELEKFCSNSPTALPVRLRASLLECFDRNNYIMLSTCFEDILRKDPTCSHSLARLIRMHQTGNYSVESLLEMIALHLDATYADSNIWREFASCLLQLSQYDEDRMSVCPDANEGGKKQSFSVRYSRVPDILTKGKSGKAWMFRCKWWLRRHFSQNMLTSEIAAGDLQLLTYKASCASHMYGQKLNYVVKVYAYLEKANDRDLFMFLQTHIHNAISLTSNYK